MFLIQIFTVCLGLLMFVVPLRRKLAILMVSCICLESVVVDFVPFGSSHLFLSNCFFLSELRNKNNILAVKQSFIYWLLVMAIMASAVLAVSSPHYQSLKGFVKIVVFELIGKYFALAYAFICVKKKEDLFPVVDAIFFSLIILTLFGFQNCIERQSQWILWLNPSGLERVEDFSVSNRFRVQSMFLNPFDYGYICALLLPLCLYLNHIKLLSKIKSLIMGFMCIWGVVYCGCRTVMVVCVMGVIYYIFMVSSPKRRLKLFSFLMVGVTLFFFYFNSIMGDFFDSISKMLESDTSTGGKGLGGSSIAMRVIQLATVLSYMPGHWLFGHGLDYFNIDLGWLDGNASALIDEGFWGLEGVYLNLLLERGIVGFLFWIIFYFIIFCFLRTKRASSKPCSALGGAVLVTYLSFAIMTGDLSSVYPTLLVLGIVIKMLYWDKEQLKVRA